MFADQATHSFNMDSSKKVITLEAERQKQNKNEKVRKIVEQLNSSQNEPTNKDLIKMVQKKIIILPLIIIGIMIMAFCCCCFCGQDECCENDTKLISTPPVVKEKLTELAAFFQEEDTQNNLLMFWIPLVLGVVFGILLIGSLIAGPLKWMNNKDNWVYGIRVQDKAALSAKKGHNLAPVEETK